MHIVGIVTGTSDASLPFSYQSVTDIAKKHHIPYLTVSNKRDLIEHEPTISSWQALVGFVASFGTIIPQSTYCLPSWGTFNLHPSLLPSFRGPSPLEQTILSGVESSGVTVIKINNGVDTGNIISQKPLPVLPTDTTLSLANRLYREGIDQFISLLNTTFDGKFIETEQDDTKATYTTRYHKEDAQIDWNLPVQQIDRMIRAYYPKPLAWTTVSELILQYNPTVTVRENWTQKRIQILEATYISGTLKPKTVVIEGKTPIPWEAFLNGYVGTIHTRYASHNSPMQ